MTDGAPPRPWCVPLRLLTPSVALAAVLAGCAGPGAGTAPRPSPSPRTTPPQELCTRLVTQWAHRLLADGGSGYGDYQSMGLSNGQYGILRTVLDAGRAEERRNGPDAARRLTHRLSERGCTERYRGGVPTGGPWQ
ncbi:hypothetical protein QMZ92_13890 [Streptomyces sp. HNM0645]|uniref:hypothetical protein n=1 Tax=Streptomyces sp. HNM0645 TaxID=2782343 RepID=UPI0024B7B318|nr:hypothetical protein [Streptomyces sp. HNM0645]MDI9885457.1 hypothetical protein [Streptomyces sp. HNM0645]